MRYSFSSFVLSLHIRYLKHDKYMDVFLDGKKQMR